MEYFDTDNITAQSVAVEDYYSRYTGQEIDNILSKVNPHVGSSDLHLQTGDRTKWNGKQDAITDLATIRQGAAAGATAVQPATLNAHINNTGVHVTSTQKATWTNHVNNGDIHVTSTQKATWTNHVNNGDIHVTAAQKASWTNHVGNSDIHVTADDKYKWNTHVGNTDIHVDGELKNDIENHLKNTGIHVTATEKTKWNNAWAWDENDIKGVKVTNAVNADKASHLGDEPLSHFLTFWNNNGTYVGVSWHDDDIKAVASSKWIQWYSGGWDNFAIGKMTVGYGATDTIASRLGNYSLSVNGKILAESDIITYGEFQLEDGKVIRWGDNSVIQYTRGAGFNMGFGGRADTPIRLYGSQTQFIQGDSDILMTCGNINSTLKGLILNAGKAIKIGDALLSYDSTNKALKVYSMNAQGVETVCHIIATGDVGAYSALGSVSSLSSLHLTDSLQVGATVMKNNAGTLEIGGSTKIGDMSNLLTGAYSVNATTVGATFGRMGSLCIGRNVSSSADLIERVAMSATKTTAGSTKYMYMTIGGKEYRIAMTEMT